MNKSYFIIESLSGLGDLGDLTARNLWFNQVFIPWGTLEKVPRSCIAFINSFEESYMPGFPNYQNNLSYFDNISNVNAMFDAFPDIVNPGKSQIVEAAKFWCVNADARLRDAIFNITKDYYAIVLLANYYSDPRISKIQNLAERLLEAHNVTMQTYTLRLQQWNQQVQQGGATWWKSVMGVVSSALNFVLPGIGSVVGGIGGVISQLISSTSNLLIQLPNGNSLQLGQGQANVNLAGEDNSLKTWLLWGLLIGGGIALIKSNKKRGSSHGK